MREAFGLVADERTRLLVLGSLPGRLSLQSGRYYDNPRNQFWQLISPAAGADLVPLAYSERLDALLWAGIGLWDVVATANRSGSLDSAIRNAQARNLGLLAAQWPQIRTMAFNGATAFKLGAPQLAGMAGVELIRLPSSSPAHAIGIEAKRPAWASLGNRLR